MRSGALNSAVAAIVTVALIAGPRAAAAGNRAPAPPASGLTISILSPRNGGAYQWGTPLIARFRCGTTGPATILASCTGTVPDGRAIDSRTDGRARFTVTAVGASGNSVTRTIGYEVWHYVNPLHRVAGLQAQRIDMGVDYAGSGPISAIGAGRVITARYVPGPEGCWGRTCAPAPGAWVVYRLLYGPFAGKFVYAVENITIRVKPGQLLRAGQTIAVLHPQSPNLEIGWAAGRAAETLAVARHQQCTCVDPGGWSSIEGRNFDRFLVWLGAPSGYLQGIPAQTMPAAWPKLPRRR